MSTGEAFLPAYKSLPKGASRHTSSGTLSPGSQCLAMLIKVPLQKGDAHNRIPSVHNCLMNTYSFYHNQKTRPHNIYKFIYYGRMTDLTICALSQKNSLQKKCTFSFENLDQYINILNFLSPLSQLKLNSKHRQLRQKNGNHFFFFFFVQ